MQFYQPILYDPEKNSSILVCVNDEADSAVALHFACLRVKRREHHLSILHVIEPTEFQGLASITEAIREEREEAAQKLLTRMQEITAAHGVEHPTLIIEEDTLLNGITTAIVRDPNISMIILAMSPESHRGPKLIAALAEEMGKTIKVPIMLVPSNLSAQEIELLS